ncbi:MAG: hypothetical protein RBS20_03560 [Atribacterota bacterium]|jgi:hypothetical protein|nr:hypothetical protein [Atribacterota bacterium]
MTKKELIRNKKKGIVEIRFQYVLQWLGGFVSCSGFFLEKTNNNINKNAS